MNMINSVQESASSMPFVYTPEITRRLREGGQKLLAELIEDEIFLRSFSRSFRLSKKTFEELPAKYKTLTEDDLLRESGIWHLQINKECLSLIHSATESDPTKAALPSLTELIISEEPEKPVIIFRLAEKSAFLHTDTTGALNTGQKDNIYRHLMLAATLARFPYLSYATEKPALKNADPVTQVSQHARRNFFTDIILGRRPSQGLRYLDATGLLSFFLPELTSGKELSQNRYHAHDIYEHLLRALDGAVEAKDYLRWSALLHDIGKVPTRTEKENGEASFHNHEMFSAKMVVPIMKRLGIPRETGQKVRFLVRNHMFHYTDEWSDKAVRRFVKKVPREDLNDLIALRLADRKGSGKKTAFPKALQKLIEHIAELQKKENEPKVSDLQINGHDLIEMGMKPGRIMGDLLKQLLAETSAGQTENEPESLRKRAHELHESLSSAENKT